MHAVAKHAGVSPMSVSNVINGRRVLPHTREAVLRAIADLDYKPNAAARALASASPVRIGLLYNSPESAFVSALLVGALDAATRFGAQLLIRRFEEHRTLSDILFDMVEGGANALILPAPYCEAASGTGLIERLNVPLIALCSGSELPDMSSVRVDDAAAARDMTNYLIGLGHRRIGFVRGAQNHIISRTRFEGYRLALLEHDLELDPDLVVDGDLTFDSGLGATEQLLSLRQPPTAIFASNDDMAAAIVSVAHRRDIRVPDQLSVAGFDDSPISRKIWPALTTVRQPIVDMTEIAVESLIEILGNPATKEPLATFTTYADYSLVIRGSTSAPGLC
ncbi:LacI family DNA-binding transcriptional regulator [Sphingomonas oligophenolica]|uniref:LacI family DNA-binding transcriptional regulator n=1 Tax=Sphingomonas oligophenolica TaxID=301154 RepID=A0ABU9Y458_9SPHN